eukprot:1129967-Amorphochlora_amoeboformis.AAC.1
MGRPSGGHNIRKQLVGFGSGSKDCGYLLLTCQTLGKAHNVHITILTYFVGLGSGGKDCGYFSLGKT